MNIWLAFMNPTKGHWWARLFRDGFRHIEILYLIGDQWVLLRPLCGQTLVEVCPYRAGDIPQDLFEDAVILPAGVSLEERHRSLVGLHTCVSWAKACLGIREPWIITPWQLYKYCAVRYAGYAYSAGRNHSGSVDQSQALPEGRATRYGAPAGSLRTDPTPVHDPRSRAPVDGPQDRCPASR